MKTEETLEEKLARYRNDPLTARVMEKFSAPARSLESVLRKIAPDAENSPRESKPDPLDECFHRDDRGRLICGDLARLKRLDDERRGGEAGRLDRGGFPKRDRQLYAERKFQPLEEFEGFAETFESFAAEKTKKRWLFLHGGNGTGKTVAACGLAVEWTRKHAKRAKFVSFPEYLAAIRKSFSRRDDGAIIDPSAFGSAEFVVLDEIKFSTHPKGWEISRLCDLIDFLHRKRARLVATSNSSLDEMVVKADKTEAGQDMLSAADRIRGNAIVVPTTWESKR